MPSRYNTKFRPSSFFFQPIITQIESFNHLLLCYWLQQVKMINNLFNVLLTYARTSVQWKDLTWPLLQIICRQYFVILDTYHFFHQTIFCNIRDISFFSSSCKPTAFSLFSRKHHWGQKGVFCPSTSSAGHYWWIVMLWDCS